MIRAFIDYLFLNPNIKKIITDVDPKNSRAIRCYEKSGFVFNKKIITPDGLAYLMEIKRNPDSSRDSSTQSIPRSIY